MKACISVHTSRVDYIDMGGLLAVIGERALGLGRNHQVRGYMEDASVP